MLPSGNANLAAIAKRIGAVCAIELASPSLSQINDSVTASGLKPVFLFEPDSMASDISPTDHLLMAAVAIRRIGIQNQ